LSAAGNQPASLWTPPYFQFLEFDVMLAYGRHRQGVD
jgi:hypothetical protein